VRPALAERPAVKLREQKRLEAEQRQARSRQRKEQQQLVHRLEKEIHQLETRQAELTAELEKPETYQQPGRALEVNRELTGALESLKKLTAEWEAAATKLETDES
jgi:ATP-binding cassette subfamily F protein 3